MVLRQSIYTYLSLTAALVWFSCSASSGVAETVLLDFNSPSCGPCQQMRPTIGRLVAAGYKVQHIDISRDQQTASRFGVNQVPTFIVLKDGQVAARTLGITSFEQLSQMLGRPNPQTPQPPTVQQIPQTFATPAAPVAPVPAQAPASNPFTDQIPRQLAQPTGSVVDGARLIEATVKLAVKDPDGVSAGTGTIVDARSGEALILTCGHLFRSSNGQGQITITMYQPGPAGAEVRSTAIGQLVDFDLDRDLALVRFRPELPIRPLPIAQGGITLVPGEAVSTVGCNNGQNPTVLATKITAINRYQGPANVEAAGAPIEGRSGGGMFNAQGQLVGVCFAADPQENEGLYAALPSVHAKLDSLGFAMVYQSPSIEQTVVPAAIAQPPVQQPPVQQLAVTPVSDLSIRGQGTFAAPQTGGDMPYAEAALPTPLPTTLSPVQSLSAVEQATFEEIGRRAADTEVICIFRPKTPGAKSEIITLNSASPEFVKRLTNSAAGQRPVPTATNGLRSLK